MSVVAFLTEAGGSVWVDVSIEVGSSVSSLAVGLDVSGRPFSCDISSSGWVQVLDKVLCIVGCSSV